MTSIKKDDERDVKFFIAAIIAVSLTLQFIGYQVWTLHEETTLEEMYQGPQKEKYGVRW